MKTILITGASSGIGKETAKLFHSKGWNVVATMRSPEDETELSTLDNVLVTRLDVLDQASINSSIDTGIARFGKIDVLLNNAGYGAYGVLESFSHEQIARQFNTNVIGLIDVTKAILPHFRKNMAGAIVNISSIGGKISFPLGALYHGTKFAVEGISESLSYELAEFGVKIKIIEPGAIATDFVGRSMDFSNDESLPEYQPIVKKVLAGVEQMFAQASNPRVVADVIFEAVTDGSDKLRYTAGEDAKAVISQRAASDDNSFIDGIKAMFKL